MTTEQLELLVVAGRDALGQALRQWEMHANESRALDGHQDIGTTDEMECRVYKHALATLKRLGAAADELEDARIERGTRSQERVDGRLETALRHLIGRAQYVCAHRYGKDDKVGTRQIAIDDLRAEIERASTALQSPIAKLSNICPEEKS